MACSYKDRKCFFLAQNAQLRPSWVSMAPSWTLRMPAAVKAQESMAVLLNVLGIVLALVTMRVYKCGTCRTNLEIKSGRSDLSCIPFLNLHDRQ